MKSAKYDFAYDKLLNIVFPFCHVWLMEMNTLVIACKMHIWFSTMTNNFEFQKANVVVWAFVHVYVLVSFTFAIGISIYKINSIYCHILPNGSF